MGTRVSVQPDAAGRARHSVRAVFDLPANDVQRTAALPPPGASSHSSSRGRRARRFSSGFHHCGANRSQPFDTGTSRCGGTRRPPLLNGCFSFHGPVSFSNSGIRHRSGLDIRLARLRRLRNRSILRSFCSACPSGSHFFKRQSCRSGLLFARLGFAWRWCF